MNKGRFFLALTLLAFAGCGGAEFSNGGQTTQDAGSDVQADGTSDSTPEGRSLSISPSEHHFDWSTGAPGVSHEFTVKNNGTEALTSPVHLSFEGQAMPFFVQSAPGQPMDKTSVCAQTLDPGETCSALVTFFPGGIDGIAPQYKASLLATSGTTQASAALTGSIGGVTPDNCLVSDPVAIVFQTKQNDSKTVEVNVTNTCPSPTGNLGVHPDMLSGNVTFGVVESNCDHPLGPGASCHFTATVHVGTNVDGGDYITTYRVFDESKDVLQIPATAQVAPGPGPGDDKLHVVFDPSFDFGEWPLGYTLQEMEFRVYNLGTNLAGPLTVTVDDGSGNPTSRFKLNTTSSNCPNSTVTPGSFCRAVVRYIPWGSGKDFRDTAKLTVSSASASGAVSLTGKTSKNDARALVVSSSGIFRYLATEKGKSATTTFIVKNDGTHTATNLSVATTENQSPDFFNVTDDCNGQLAAGSKCTITVTFAPQAVSLREAAISVDYSWNNTGSGNGNPPAATANLWVVGRGRLH